MRFWIGIGILRSKYYLLLVLFSAFCKADPYLTLKNSLLEAKFLLSQKYI
jgi:hypothetical protein